MRVLVVRPVADAAATVRRLGRRGIDALESPVTEIIATGAALPATLPQALLMTSANAARAAAPHERLKPVPVFAVGERTADVAREGGFQTVEAAGGSSEDLLRLVRTRLDPGDGPVLYLAGRHTAGDLAGDLRTAGYDVTGIVVYEAVALPALPGAVRAALAAGSVRAVLFYSPRGARLFGDLARRAIPTDRATPADRAIPTDWITGLSAACLSARVADAAETAGFRHVLAASSPDEDALIAALEELLAGD